MYGRNFYDFCIDIFTSVTISFLTDWNRSRMEKLKFKLQCTTVCYSIPFVSLEFPCFVFFVFILFFRLIFFPTELCIIILLLST